MGHCLRFGFIILHTCQRVRIALAQIHDILEALALAIVQLHRIRINASLVCTDSEPGGAAHAFSTKRLAQRQY
jgi:hypothetical protein